MAAVREFVSRIPPSANARSPTPSIPASPPHSAPTSIARNFKLLDELDDAEKSSKGGADISLGLVRPDDTYMSDWQASIFAQAVRRRGVAVAVL